jgi:hypothetical protein
VKRGNFNSASRAVLGLRGTVIEATFASGSKSERNAPFLQTEDQRYLLRRRGGPSYGDATLTRFVGQVVECDGTVTSYLLLVDRIERVD